AARGGRAAKRGWFGVRPSSLVAEQVLQQRMPRLPQPQLPRGVDLWGVHPVIAAEAGLRGDQVETGQDLDGEAERLGHPGDLAAQPAEDAADLAVFLPLEHGPLGAE